jgi:hypothetical protein
VQPNKYRNLILHVLGARSVVDSGLAPSSTRLGMPATTPTEVRMCPSFDVQRLGHDLGQRFALTERRGNLADGPTLLT